MFVLFSTPETLLWDGKHGKITISSTKKDFNIPYLIVVNIFIHPTSPELRHTVNEPGAGSQIQFGERSAPIRFRQPLAAGWLRAGVASAQARLEQFILPERTVPGSWTSMGGDFSQTGPRSFLSYLYWNFRVLFLLLLLLLLLLPIAEILGLIPKRLKFESEYLATSKPQ